MAAFATRDAVAMEEMRTVSSPNSPADLYATYQIERTRSFPQEEPDRIETRPDGTIEACAQLPDGTESCAVYSDFEYESGLISSFAIDDLSIDGRLVEPGAFGTREGILATLVTACRSGQGSVWVYADVANGLDIEITVAGDVSEYVEPDGARTGPFNGTGRGPTILPRETGRVVLRFEDSELGGSLDLKVLTADTEVRVPIAIG